MDKQQIKARFFGAHIGCKMIAIGSHGEVAEVNRGVVMLADGRCYIESDGIGRVYIDNCKLVLRPLSSITQKEVNTLCDIIWNNNNSATKLYHGDVLEIFRDGTDPASWVSKQGGWAVDWLRSRNFALSFCGLDPIIEGWAILEEKIPANH